MAWNVPLNQLANTSRRKVLATSVMSAISLTVRSSTATGEESNRSKSAAQWTDPMASVTTKDGVRIFYKDWGPKSAQPIVFHHGWPLCADDWDTQMLYFAGKGYRVIAHDRRGHGRSSQVGDGHDMDHYAADAAAVVDHLDLRNAIHVGHSTGGGEAVRYVARHGRDRVAKLVLISAVPPLMLKTEGNPGGLPIDVLDDLRRQLAANRAQFYFDFASGPFYGYNRPGVPASQAVIWNWWRQGMMGGAKAHYDGIKAFSETDFTEDLKSIAVPTLVLHGGDDQIVPVVELRASVGEAAQEQHAQNLRRTAARHLHDPCRYRERRTVGVHRGLILRIDPFKPQEKSHATGHYWCRLCRHVCRIVRRSPARHQGRFAREARDRAGRAAADAGGSPAALRTEARDADCAAAGCPQGDRRSLRAGQRRDGRYQGARSRHCDARGKTKEALLRSPGRGHRQPAVPSEHSRSCRARFQRQLARRCDCP